ncbi:bifunctional diguanylate cyclase/phosphodiesterase [Noviherbaspirillum humi]|uniref:bifunctional diguanylate cyclase/phosphodiesterase n=1 Tax=Noviherbaspirillum humi TaxID=1688639 RepID=UPI001594E7E3|nr:EAL domain-containing protein [Noviherbaspirillum humi]
MLLFIYTTSTIQQDELSKAKLELESVGKLVVANQQQLVEGERQILATVASGPSLRRSNLHSLCIEFLQNVLVASPGNANISLLDMHANVVCQANESLPHAQTASRSYFLNAIAGKEFSLGRDVVRLASGKNSIGFGMPVYDYADNLIGVAVGLLDLDYTNRQLQSIALPEYFHISVVDANANVLATSVNTTEKLGVPVSNPMLKSAILRHAPADFMASDKQGNAWLHTLKPIGGTGPDGLMVAISVRKEDIVSVANGHFRQQLILMTLASLAGLLAAWLFAQRCLAKPVAQLLERMRCVEQGQSFNACSTPVAKNLEFMELNEGFSSMLSKLEKNQQQLIRAQQITRVGFYQLDLQTRLYTASPIVYEILGLDPAVGPLTVEQYQSMIFPDDRELVKKHRERLFSGGEPLRLQYRLVQPGGTIRWIDAYGFLQKNEQGTPILYSGAIQDITDRKVAEQAQRANENRFRLLFENSLDGILQTDGAGKIIKANPAACSIFGMSEAQLIKCTRDDVVFAEDARLQPLLEERDATGQARGTLTMKRGDGTRFEAELAASVYKDDEGKPICSLILRDITERIKAEQNIHQLAFFDALTHLPNRRLLMDRLALLHAVAQHLKQIGAVMFIDLDRFKNVNDARGHAIGDELLKQVADRLSSLMRSEDTVARIGGDEFVILMPDLATDLFAGAQQAMAAAEKIQEKLTLPFQINGQPYGAAASIGVTLFPKADQTTEDLLREADTAMYRAKHAGRNRIAFFEPSMQMQVEERLSLENELAHALGTSQLEMYLQPQFTMHGRPVGCEMLVRWTHPVRGILSPAAFIPVAEESDLICRLGEWTIREGCQTLLRLHTEERPMTVSVNVSPRQFHETEFVEMVGKILRETGAPASQLIFEVTEGLLIDRLDQTIARMDELVDMGIRFSIDDFGTGYSSLAYLRRLPLYELKIDRSFVRCTPDDQGGTAIVQSILSLAKNLNLKVVAEGVETPEQSRFLYSAGCDFLQGYLLAPPMPFKSWLQKLKAKEGMQAAAS